MCKFNHTQLEEGVGVWEGYRVVLRIRCANTVSTFFLLKKAKSSHFITLTIILVSKSVSQNICKAQLLQPKQSRVRLIMSHRPNKIVLSSVYSRTVLVLSTMDVESVADHSRWKVWRQQNYVVHTLTFLPKAPSDRRVTQNGENDD